jgi:preprotein translocase subunit SecF
MQIFHNPNYNFVRWRWHAIAVSWLVIVAGLITIYTRGLPLGIEPYTAFTSAGSW